MLGKNFLGSVSFHHIGGSVNAGTDSASGGYTGAASRVDMAAIGARRAMAVMELGACVANSTIDLTIETSDETASGWAAAATVNVPLGVQTTGKFVAVEVDTNSVPLKRYVRFARQRKGANSAIVNVFFVLGDVRVPGEIANGDLIGGGVGKQVSS